MAANKHCKFQNLLLAALPPKELDLLSRGFEPVELPRRRQLELPGRKIDHVYFMESGITSIVAHRNTGTQVEVGIIGREGMTGLAIVLANDRFPYSSYIQVEGSAQRIAAKPVQDAMARSAECRQVFLNFAQTFLLQTSETAIANARATVEERLARWLLMARDRVDGDEIPLTHEFLALMMGARRAGVTEAMLELSRKGLVRGGRGRVVILDSAALEERAGENYGLPEGEYARLFPASEKLRPSRPAGK